jgi:hypothetical protein
MFLAVTAGRLLLLVELFIPLQAIPRFFVLLGVVMPDFDRLGLPFDGLLEVAGRHMGRGHDLQDDDVLLAF